MTMRPGNPYLASSSPQISASIQFLMLIAMRTLSSLLLSHAIERFTVFAGGTLENFRR